MGDRCEIKVGGARGKVAYVGKVVGKDRGYWIGIQLDEPTGDINGQYRARKYFECPDKFGCF